MCLVCRGTLFLSNRGLKAGAALAVKRLMIRTTAFAITFLALGCSGSASDLSKTSDHLDDCRVGGTEESCVTKGGEVGVAACQDGKTVSECGVVGDCHPGDKSPACPTAVCKLFGDTWAFEQCG